MKIRPSTLRAALLLAVAAFCLNVSGCTSGPHQQPVTTSSTTHDGKDSKDHHPDLNDTSGPHQGH